jgi:aryl-alcohol dehydrogenase-like predicted oxidoreductase
MIKQTDLGGTFSLQGASITVNRMGYGAMQLAGSARRQRNCRPFLQLTIRRGATFLAAVYSNESSQQRTAKGTKNGCTSDTQRA